jgi:hypothetical protein
MPTLTARLDTNAPPRNAPLSPAPRSQCLEPSTTIALLRAAPRHTIQAISPLKNELCSHTTVMKFTPREMRLIDGQRKLGRRSRLLRWCFLVVGASILGACGYTGSHAVALVTSDQPDKAGVTLLFAYVWPIVLMMACFAGAFIGLAIRDWYGNATRVLLLKLLDAQQEQTHQDGSDKRE